MRARAETGEPMMMVDGLGWVWNRWAILSVEETKTVFLADGAPQKIEFSMELQAYGEDRL
jgi:phage protein U